MAEEGAGIPGQLTADRVKEEEESQSTDNTHDENTNQQQHAEGSSAITNKGDIKDDGKNMEHAVDKNGDSAEKKTPEEESPSPENSAAQADDGGQGDYDRGTPRQETTTMKDEESCYESSNESGEDNACEETEGETASAPHLSERNDTEVDGANSGLNEETQDSDDPIAEAEEDDGSQPGQNPQVLQTPSPEDRENRNREIKTIGPLDQNPTEHPAPVNTGGRKYLVAVGIVALCAAVLIGHFRQPESPSKKKDLQQVDIFLRQMEKLKTQYPHQRNELWNRSRIHLLRHLQTAQPTEPVSLMLVAGHRAEKTLHCLAQSLASAFSSALNASVVHIDGASKASQDSDQVKMDIDTKLQGAFEGDKPVAVIHRFEELPPGSTLIFYRYCDHENAAYKKTCLIFTVLLGEEEEIPTKSHLSAVEEMVDDHLKMKFLSDGQPVSFDRMDLDKYGGLWSRISHLILPVAADKRIEQDGC